MSAAAKKRGYSREFTPRVRTLESRRRITLDWIPPTFYERIVSKAKAEGVSVRTYVLRLLAKAVSE